jgi:hypothetical protein
MKPLSRLLAHLLVLGALAMPLAGQGLRFELGGFGSFTRYDDALMLDDRVGGGARLALHFNRFLGLELEGVYLGPGSTTGGPSYGLHLGSVSLMLGGGGDRFSVYALGGYSRFDVGTDVPYNYATNGYHGGGGLRLGLSDRLAIRFDGRAVFGQEDNIAGGSAMHLVGSLGLAYFTGSRRASERDEPEPPAPIEDVPSPQQPPMAEGREPDEPAMPEAGRREPPPPPRAARLKGSRFPASRRRALPRR